MNKRLSISSTLCVLLFLGTQCASTKKVNNAEDTNIPRQQPTAEREFRAAWIASVANINWPSEPGLPVEKQKEEAIALLDFLAKNNFNAAILQVRPQCDALYPSELEPWSYYLSGTQGEAPQPYYDPLAFWIEEAHKRAIELHAWLNPYRAHHVAGGPISDQSIVKTKPELLAKLEAGYHWMVPTAQETQDHSYNVVMDIVKRYDVDGIHFDDYFYPYPSYNNDKDFPDESSWAEYQKAGGKLSKGDWRRDAVNTFMKRVYDGIKAEKKHVKFGLSPFGIWRPNNPPSIKGFDQYDKLYADAKLWFNEGWIDYWTPQLYWPINQIPQSFPVLLGWWKQQNYQGRHFWPGISISRKKGKEQADEVVNQIMISRGMLPESPGIVHWSIGGLTSSEMLTKAVAEGPYQKKALIPASPWLDNVAPKTPAVKVMVAKDSLQVNWSPDNTEELFAYV
ncbi:MAG: family 10 glycosylhydrolase, partial [Bacteroidota bacterium]